MKNPLKSLTNDGEEMNSHLKIGVFGYTAVGKTTFLATLYYLLSVSKYPHHNLSGRQYSTNEYIKERIEFITKFQWDRIPPNQGKPIDLYLDLFRNNKRYPLFMKDYRGEDISRGPETELFSFFESCDGIMVCLSPENVSGNSVNFVRHQEINTLLNSLVKFSRNAKTNTPIALVITKYDMIVGKIGEYDPDQLIRDKFRDTFNMLSVHARSLNIFAVSAKQCMESLRTQNFYEEIQSPRSPINIAQPLFWIVDRIESNRRKPFRFIIAAIGVGIIVFFSSLSLISYSKYNGIGEFATKNVDNPQIVLEKYKQYHESFWSLFVPVSNDSIQNKIKYWFGKYEDFSFKRILSNRQDYQTVLPMISAFYNEFHNSRYQNDIQQIQNEALQLKRAHEIALEEAKRRAELEAIRRAQLEASRQQNTGGGRCGCFIATAIYGSYETPQVKKLRKFRDNTLYRYCWGRQFIKFYYQYSPPIANWLKGRKKISMFVRIFLLEPIIFFL